MKQILKYTIPTILSLLMSGLYTIIDGLFIGQHSSDVGLTAINLAWPIPALFIATGIGIGVGGSILYSQKVGTEHYRQGYYALLTTLISLVIAGIFFFLCFLFVYDDILRFFGASGEVFQQANNYLTIVIYGCIFQVFATGVIPILRNLHYPMQAMVISICGVIMNIILNYIFIFQMDMGVAGAALGTLLSQIIVSFLTILLLFKNRNVILELKDKSHERVNRHIIKEIIVRSATPFGLSLTPSVVLVFSNYACLMYGSIEAVAAYTVISYITFPVTNMLLGIGDGMQPLMSLKYGQNNQAELSKICKAGYHMGIVLSIIIMIVIFFTRDQIADLFGLSPIAHEYFLQGIFISLFAVPFIFFLKFKISINNATGQSIIATKITYIESVIVAPIFIFVFAFVLGINGIWLSYVATNILLCIMIYMYHSIE